MKHLNDSINEISNNINEGLENLSKVMPHLDKGLRGEIDSIMTEMKKALINKDSEKLKKLQKRINNARNNY